MNQSPLVVFWGLLVTMCLAHLPAAQPACGSFEKMLSEQDSEQTGREWGGAMGPHHMHEGLQCSVAALINHYNIRKKAVLGSQGSHERLSHC